VDEGTEMPWQADLSRLHAPTIGGRARRRPSHLKALVSCDAVVDELPLVVDGSRRPSHAMDEHLRSCPSCQAELAGYRRLLRALRSLRDQPLGAPAPPFGEETWRALADCLEARSRAAGRWRLAGAATLALVALGGGAALVRFIRQSRLLAAGAGAL
jgi:anti-sigma factor RsiW